MEYKLPMAEEKTKKNERKEASRTKGGGGAASGALLPAVSFLGSGSRHSQRNGAEHRDCQYIVFLCFLPPLLFYFTPIKSLRL